VKFKLKMLKLVVSKDIKLGGVNVRVAFVESQNTDTYIIRKENIDYLKYTQDIAILEIAVSSKTLVVEFDVFKTMNAAIAKINDDRIYTIKCKSIKVI